MYLKMLWLKILGMIQILQGSDDGLVKIFGFGISEPENLKKSRPKKFVKSNKSISRKKNLILFIKIKI